MSPLLPSISKVQLQIFELEAFQRLLLRSIGSFFLVQPELIHAIIHNLTGFLWSYSFGHTLNQQNNVLLSDSKLCRPLVLLAPSTGISCTSQHVVMPTDPAAHGELLAALAGIPDPLGSWEMPFVLTADPIELLAEGKGRAGKPHLGTAYGAQRLYSGFHSGIPNRYCVLCIPRPSCATDLVDSWA